MGKPHLEEEPKKHNEARRAKGKLSLSTSRKDYAGNLGVPEKIVQREFETTGQFFRRLDRLVAKAKVEASLESRFDMTLGKKKQDKIKEKVPEKDSPKASTRRPAKVSTQRSAKDSADQKPVKKRKKIVRRSNNSLDDDIAGGSRGRHQKSRKNFRKGGGKRR